MDTTEIAGDSDPASLVHHERLRYIDIAKFIGIFILFFEHTGNWVQLAGHYNLIKIWICSFHMPLFFILYGIVASSKARRSMPQWFDKRIRSLLVPYLLWALIYAAAINRNFFFGVAWGTNPSLGVAGVNQVLWFLPAMFLAATIDQLFIELKALIHVSDKVWADLLILAILLLAGFYGHKEVIALKMPYGFWFSFDISCIGAAFIVAGRIIKKSVFWLYKKPYVLKIAAALGCCLAGAFIANHNTPSEYWVTVMACGFYGKHFILFFVTACLSTFGIIALSMCLEKIRLLSWLGEGTLFLMAVHYLIFPHTVVWCSNWFPAGMRFHNVLLPFANAAICSAICIPLLFVCERYIPALKGKA
jgi:fucose 4-O-acetylase-like acetyltransferase